MKALFLYIGHYGCSRCDSLYYVGLLEKDQNPIDLIKKHYLLQIETKGGEHKVTALIEKETKKKLPFMDKTHDGETSYVVLELDKPSLFLGSFEHEGDLNTIKLDHKDFIQ